MPTEPTNEQLHRWKEYYACHSGPIPNCKEFATTIDALLEAREELTAVTGQIQRLQPGSSPPPGGCLTLTSWIVSQTQALITERDSLRGELEAAKTEVQKWRESWLAEHDEAVRRNLGSACLVCCGKGDSGTGRPCICNGTGDAQTAQGELTRLLYHAEQERDAARAGEARLRELYEKLIRDFESGKSMTFFPGIPDACRKALSSTADSAKWLEDRLAEAEQRGYERGKAEEQLAARREREKAGRSDSSGESDER